MNSHIQVSHSTSLLRGRAVVLRAAACRPACTVRVAVVADADRFRLNNLGPAPGSRRQEKRKGRGYGAGQGGTCGFGMRGQKARSGSGTRPGFEGGQMPLYRRLPKLRGIAGGMSAGLPKFITVNLNDLKRFGENEEVTLDKLKEVSVLNISGSDTKLPLKILGDGELTVPLTIKAHAFTEQAMQKIEAAGGKAEVVPQKPKWTRKLHESRKAASKK